MQLFEYRSVRYWSKEINGTLPGGQKNFFIRGRGRPTVFGGRAGAILSIRSPEVSRGSPMVGSRRAQSPTPHARALPSIDTYQYRSSAVCGLQYKQMVSANDYDEFRIWDHSFHAIEADLRI